MHFSLNMPFCVVILLLSVSIIPLTSAQVSPVAIFQSPKKQHEQGLLTYEVRCNDGLVLMEKKSDGSPACVKSQTAQKLYQRGWGDFMASPQVLNSNTGNSSMGTMNVTNTKLSVNYTITNAKILNIIKDPQVNSMIVRDLCKRWGLMF